MKGIVAKMQRATELRGLQKWTEYCRKQSNQSVAATNVFKALCRMQKKQVWGGMSRWQQATAANRAACGQLRQRQMRAMEVMGRACANYARFRLLCGWRSWLSFMGLLDGQARRLRLMRKVIAQLHRAEYHNALLKWVEVARIGGLEEARARLTILNLLHLLQSQHALSQARAMRFWCAWVRHTKSASAAFARFEAVAYRFSWRSLLLGFSKWRVNSTAIPPPALPLTPDRPAAHYLLPGERRHEQIRSMSADWSQAADTVESLAPPDPVPRREFELSGKWAAYAEDGLASPFQARTMRAAAHKVLLRKCAQQALPAPARHDMQFALASHPITAKHLQLLLSLNAGICARLLRSAAGGRHQDYEATPSVPVNRYVDKEMPRAVANHSAAQLDAFLRRGQYAYGLPPPPPPVPPPPQPAPAPAFAAAARASSRAGTWARHLARGTVRKERLDHIAVLVAKSRE